MTIDFNKELEEVIQSETSSGAKMKTVNKEDYRENLSMIALRLQNLKDIFSGLNPKMRSILASRILTEAKVKGQNSVACSLYSTIAKSVNKNDSTIAFASAESITLNYIKILDSIIRMYQDLFTEKYITIYNTRLSQVAVFGIVTEMETFVTYTTFLFDNITFELCRHNNVNELPQPKKYRLMYLNDNLQTYIGICKLRTTVSADVVVSDFVKSRSLTDVNIANDNGSNLQFVDSDKLAPTVKNSISGSKSFLPSIFRWIGEQWLLYKHAKYLKAKKEKEWIQSHVALLQLELQNVDPNSDEYRKYVKIIESYNEQIADLDQKINSYENS